MTSPTLLPGTGNFTPPRWAGVWPTCMQSWPPAEPTNPDFAPEVAAAPDVAGWADGVSAQLDAALTALAGVTQWPDDEIEALAGAVKSRRASLHDAIGRLSIIAAALGSSEDSNPRR